MSGTRTGWLRSKSAERQLVTLALVLDPIGFLAGYLLAPTFDVDPLVGGVYGLIAASVPISMWVFRYAQN